MKYFIFLSIALCGILAYGQQVFCEENKLFFRMYSNTGNIINSSLGYSLKHNYENTIYQNPSNKQIQAILPNGKINTYTPIGENIKNNSDIFGNISQTGSIHYTAAFQNHTQLLQTKDTFIITDTQENTSYTYTKTPLQLTQITTPNQTLEFLYNNNFPPQLDTITDNQTNSLFFSYNDTNQLTKVSDIYHNTLTFDYTQKNNIPLLTQITDNTNKTMSIDPTNIILKNQFAYNFPPPQSRGIEGESSTTPIYTHSPNNTLYSALNNTVYQIDTTTHQRRAIFKSTFPIRSLAVTDDTIYLLHTYKKQYITYTPSNNTTLSIPTKEYFEDIEIQNNQLNFLDHISNQHIFEKNPEFTPKYGEKISQLKAKLLQEYGKEKWQKLTQKIQAITPKFLKNIKDDYLREEYRFIIEKLLQTTF